MIIFAEQHKAAKKNSQQQKTPGETIRPHRENFEIRSP